MPNLLLVCISGNLDRKGPRAKGSCSPGVCDSTCGREAAQKGRCCCQGNQEWKGSGHPLLDSRRELGFALTEPGGQEAPPPHALPQHGTLPLGKTAQLAQAVLYTAERARPCFSLAEVPAAFRNPDDKVQAKRKESRSHLSFLFQISNCRPLNCCFFAIICEKNSCLSCFN